MSNVHKLVRTKNLVTKDQLETLESLEASLVDMACREVADVVIQSEDTDYAEESQVKALKAKKENASSTVLLMNRLGVYSAAKRGVLSRDQWAAGNYPQKDVDRARQIVEFARKGGK